MPSNIDHAGSVAAARQWARDMIAWKDCMMSQRLFCLLILGDTDRQVEPADQFAALVKLSAIYREREANKKPGDRGFLWTLQQLDNCLAPPPAAAE
jgi:hypothetical protein